MKVALIHDYLIEYGGAERVLEALHKIFPKAPVYVAYYDGRKFKDWNIKTSWLQFFPKKLISPFRIFAPKIFEGFNLSDYDLVISSCNVYFSKAVKTKGLHISYIHTPPRYLYGYTTSFNYKKHWWTRLGGELANHFLRIVDFEVSQRPDILVANSKNVQARIKKFYRRDSVVIYPPLEIGSKYQAVSSKGKKNYYLSVGRLVRGKGIEVIVEACAKLGLPLKVVGIGPEMDSLRTSVDRHKNVNFLGQVKDENLPGLYAGAIATIVASEDEDFGIVPVESLSSGTPVIAVKAGGFLETIIPGKTGQFFDTASVESLTIVLENFDPKNFKKEDLINQAEKFSKERFVREITELIDKHLDNRLS